MRHIISNQSKFIKIFSVSFITAKKTMVLLTILLIATINLGCNFKNYQVSLNQHTVYMPPSLFMDYSLTDENLKKCVRSSIEESKITSVEKIVSLHCPGYEITSLEGIQAFTHLRTLALNNNKIHSISEIETLIHLNHLNLAGNQISSFAPLNNLKELNFVNMSGNPLTNCKEVDTAIAEKIVLPESCLIP